MKFISEIRATIVLQIPTILFLDCERTLLIIAEKFGFALSILLLTFSYLRLIVLKETIMILFKITNTKMKVAKATIVAIRICVTYNIGSILGTS
jgi:hypothetical protein